MFLNELKDDLKKILFIELSALIMMSEGMSNSMPLLSDKLKEEANEMSIEDIESLDFNTLLAGYRLLQNIDESEKDTLNRYMIELDLLDLHVDPLDRNYKSYDSNLSFYSQEPDETDPFPTLCYALGGVATDVLERGKTNPEVRDVIISLISENLITNPIKIKEKILEIPSIQKEILENTAEILIKTKMEEVSIFSEKEKKIMLFELVGAAFSSGHFEDKEKSLLSFICEVMGIDKEYLDEFTDVTTRLFSVNKELTELINE